VVDHDCKGRKHKMSVKKTERSGFKTSGTEGGTKEKTYNLDEAIAGLKQMQQEETLGQGKVN